MKESILRFTHIDSPLNLPFYIVMSSRGICWTAFHLRGTEKACLEEIQAYLKASLVRKDDEALKEARQQLQAYFEGTLKNFSLAIDILHGTPFQRRVWQALSAIPYGQTWSYSEVAQAIGLPRAVRAVGAANGKNPLPVIIPCHRVISKNGELGGYSSGLKIKAWLLDLESGVRL